MKLLLLGKNGQVGWELQRALAPLGEVTALDRQGHDGMHGDLSRLDALRETVGRLRPDVIVNAAAYTAVDKAESEPDVARVLNAEAPAVLAQEAAASGAWLVHYSTDYVFDGSGSTPRDESAATAPLSVYGQTKLEGERAIAASGCRHLVFRTSWVYAARGANFAKTMLRLAADRDQLRIVADQIGAPTGADLIADVTAHAVRHALREPDAAGLYHLAAGGEVSWHGYACHVIEWARARGHAVKVAAGAVQAIPSNEYPTPARRPLNSRLSTRRLEETFGLALPAWQAGVDRMLSEVLG
ncbi:dTDP-4-dehydrorhamnose reductase [Methylibium rhizosphaerae]|uniref:dTDP-4-dehydrorhamnose reductase n=1 Tax=Methylibium rhizosphaerae TaxID=2570323 RepID=UPI00112E1911|nr:dTDP-4-dehydrorhamnose reductase [Methylibium rhizosphaerae]